VAHVNLKLVVFNILFLGKGEHKLEKLNLLLLERVYHYSLLVVFQHFELLFGPFKVAEETLEQILDHVTLSEQLLTKGCQLFGWFVCRG